MQIKSLWRVTLRAAQDWWEDNCLRLAASLAYYTALSLAPAGAAHRRRGRDGARTGTGGRSARHPARKPHGPGRPRAREQHSHDHEPGGGTLATVVGLVTLVIGATAVFGELQATMNLIWEVRPAPTNGVWAGIWAWLKARIFSLSHCLRARVSAPRLARHQRRPGGCSRALLGPGADAPEPPPGNRRLAAGPHPRVFLALQVRAGCRDRLARRVARRSHDRGALHPWQDRDRLLPRLRAAWARPTGRPARWSCCWCGSTTRP